MMHSTSYEAYKMSDSRVIAGHLWNPNICYLLSGLAVNPTFSYIMGLQPVARQLVLCGSTVYVM